jgi:hypothetical protein
LKRVAAARETAPPQRILPFAKRSGSATKSAAPVAVEQDVDANAGETDDDEL